MKKLENSICHLYTIEQYLIYRADLHDIIKQRFDIRKQKITTRYNREVLIITHHIDDLIIIFQKNIDKFQIK